MKKILLTLVFALSFGLFSCDDSTGPIETEIDYYNSENGCFCLLNKMYGDTLFTFRTIENKEIIYFEPVMGYEIHLKLYDYFNWNWRVPNNNIYYDSTDNIFLYEEYVDSVKSVTRELVIRQQITVDDYNTIIDSLYSYPHCSR